LWQRAGVALDGDAGESAKEWLLSLQQQEVREKQVITREPRKASDTPPILVTTLQFGDNESTRGMGHTLNFLDASGSGVKITLDDATLHTLIRLLDETLATCEWRLDLWRPLSSVTVLSPTSQSLH